MKKFNVHRNNYPTTFKYTKPDEYFDGFLVVKSWYFSICDWMGNEIFGTHDENKMIQKIEEMQDNDEDEDIQLFAYPTIDGELINKSHPNDYGEWVWMSEAKRENYVFDY